MDTCATSSLSIPVDGHLDCVHILATVNSAAIPQLLDKESELN